MTKEDGIFMLLWAIVILLFAGLFLFHTRYIDCGKDAFYVKETDQCVPYRNDMQKYGTYMNLDNQ